MPATEDNPPPVGTSNAKSKKKNKKKKAAASHNPSNGDGPAANGVDKAVDDAPEDPDLDDEVQTPIAESPTKPSQSSDNSSDLSEKLDAMAEERDKLRQEVAELRKSLEDIRGRHDQEVQELSTQLEHAQTGREEAETQHRNLKERVTTITASLGQRMRANEDEIRQNNARIEELESQSQTLEHRNAELESMLDKQAKQHELQAKEIDSLRNRGTLSQQNWIRERDELISREALAREEYETTKQAMQEWEVLALEERALRKDLTEQSAELEEQLANLRNAYEKAVSDRDSQSQTVDNLQRAMQEIQQARKRELRELVESSEAQLEQVRKKQQVAEDEAKSSREELHNVKKELERALPFEKEVKEKNLLIGKLRHEGVILNDHLTKALRFIKQRNPEDMIDRQVVTNHFLHFITLDRSDPRKFQVLQLIAALLAWDDEQKEQAGLARPGGSALASTLRVPLSPFRRTPSTPSLADSALMEQRASKEGLAELWSDFLEREAAEGSRRPSTASGATEGGKPAG